MRTLGLKPFPNDFYRESRDFDILRGIIIAKKIFGQPAENVARIWRVVKYELLAYQKLKRKYPVAINQSHLKSIANQERINIKLCVLESKKIKIIYSTGDKFPITAHFKINRNLINDEYPILKNLHLLHPDINERITCWSSGNDIKIFADFDELLKFKLENM